MYDYNTTRSALLLKEYGRNVQKLVEQVKTVEDKTLRNQKACSIVKLMESLDVHTESLQKRWDDLFAMVNYELDVDSPYPKPIKPDMHKHCFMDKLAIQEIKYKHYGRNMELLFRKLLTLPTVKEQEELLVELVRLMRRFGNTWNNDSISNEKIIEDTKRMLPEGVTFDIDCIRSIVEDMDHLPRNRNNGSTKHAVASYKRKESTKRNLTQ